MDVQHRATGIIPIGRTSYNFARSGNPSEDLGVYPDPIAQPIWLLAGHKFPDWVVYARMRISSLRGYFTRPLNRTFPWPMKFTSRSIVCGLGLMAGLAGLAAPAQAQNADTQANPLADFQTQNNDPFSAQGDANSNMMNLMQRIMQGERPDPAAFAASQQDNMNDAMANFRAKQMQLIKARQAQRPPGQAAVVTPAQPGVVTPISQPGASQLAPAPLLVMPLK
jgi:hypothetical protein